MIIPLATTVKPPRPDDVLFESFKSSVEMAMCVLANAPLTLDGLARARHLAVFILGEAWREADTGRAELQS